jgi:hypothetical protein
LNKYLKPYNKNITLFICKSKCQDCNHDLNDEIKGDEPEVAYLVQEVGLEKAEGEYHELVEDDDEGDHLVAVFPEQFLCSRVYHDEESTHRRLQQSHRHTE